MPHPPDVLGLHEDGLEFLNLDGGHPAFPLDLDGRHLNDHRAVHLILFKFFHLGSHPDGDQDQTNFHLRPLLRGFALRRFRFPGTLRDFVGKFDGGVKFLDFDGGHPAFLFQLDLRHFDHNLPVDLLFLEAIAVLFESDRHQKILHVDDRVLGRVLDFEFVVRFDRRFRRVIVGVVRGGLRLQALGFRRLFGFVFLVRGHPRRRRDDGSSNRHADRGVLIAVSSFLRLRVFAIRPSILPIGSSVLSAFFSLLKHDNSS